MSEIRVPKLTLAELQGLIDDREELGKGALLFDKKALSQLARYQNKLFCEAAGSGSSPYKVSLNFGETGKPKARCSCPAARTRPYCKHAAALLFAWARAPESFVVSESGPADAGDKKPKRVKTGKSDKGDIMGRGIEQVATLVRELAVSGVAAIGGDRVEQVRTLGESLRESKLRRLSARAIELADLLQQAASQSASFSAGEYTDHLADMLLTVRKLEKHLAGEPLDDRHVEELIGKTWTKKDRKPIEGLHLVEYAFSTRRTPDDFLIRESRFFDVASGKHYSEKQILPGFLVKRTEAKKSYQGLVLLGASGSLYPSFAPLRLDLEDRGTPDAVSPIVLEQLLSTAMPSVSAALLAFQEQRRDVFAPARLPVAVRTGTLLAEGSKLSAIDEEGQGLVLPWARDPGLEDRFCGVLRGTRLRALLGEVDVDDALPTLFPLAAVVEGPLGLQLRTLTVSLAEPGKRSRRAGARAAQKGAGAAAGPLRAAGASPAALALLEVREEMAQALVSGLLSLGPRMAEPLSTRLLELGLAKQAALMQAIAGRQEAPERLDDFIKLYQVLEIALLRLCSAVRVERDALVAVPTFESVHVRRSTEVLAPREVGQRRQKGQLGRYEAAFHYARYYEGLTAEQLSARIFPTWADGGAVPYVVRALAQRGQDAVAAAHRALRAKGHMAKTTAVHVLRAVGGPEAEALLAQVAKGEFRDVRSFVNTGHAYWYWEWGGTIPPLQVLAQDALDALQLGSGPQKTVEAIQDRRQKQGAQLSEHLQQLAAATQSEQRVEAVRHLAKLGDLQAAPALRLSATSDDSQEVRGEALLALGLLGDAETVEAMVGALGARESQPEQAKAAAYALGYMGDARGIEELLAAFAEAWQPIIIAEALRAVGGVVLEPLVALLESRPDLLQGRKAALDVLQKLPAEDLYEHLHERLMAQRESPDLAERARLYVKLAGHSAPVLARFVPEVVAVLGGRTDAASQEVRKLAEKTLAKATAEKKPRRK